MLGGCYGRPASHPETFAPGELKSLNTHCCEDVVCQRHTFGTGKVPVEGSLAESYCQPVAGQAVLVYFNVTSLSDADKLTLTIALPETAKLIGREGLNRTYENVHVGQTFSMIIMVRVTNTEPLRITALANLSGSELGDGSRAFILTLNEKPDNTPPGKVRINKQGREVITYTAE